MINVLWNWLIGLINVFGSFGTWLTTEISVGFDIDFLGFQSVTFTPLGVFSVGILSVIVIASAVHLFTI